MPSTNDPGHIQPKKRQRTSKSITPEAAPDDPDPFPSRSTTSSGILQLPTELISEIISYFPSITPDTCVTTKIQILDETYVQRPDVLRALSQTSREHREVFLPILWETLDVCASRTNTGAAFYSFLAETLTRKCAGLEEAKHLHLYVRTINVILSRYRTATVLPPFISCIQTLPSLHTLHVVYANSQITTPLKDSLVGCNLSTVRTIILPPSAHELLKCCPEVRSVKCLRDDYEGGKLITHIAKWCKKVENLEGFKVDEKLMKRVVKAVPNLRSIRFHQGVTYETLRLLAPLKKLDTVGLDASTREDEEHMPWFDECADIVKEIFEKQSSKGKKYLNIWYRAGGMKCVELDPKS